MGCLGLLLCISLFAFVQSQDLTIHDVDFQNIATVHQTQFLSLIEGDPQKRAEILGQDFFKLSGIRLPEGHSHDFIVREDPTVPTEERATGEYPTIYSGYSAEDIQVVIVLLLPENFGKERIKGNIHWANGEMHDVEYSAPHGLTCTQSKGRATNPGHATEVHSFSHVYHGNRTNPAEIISHPILKRQTSLGRKVTIRAFFNADFQRRAGGTIASARAAISNALASVNAVTSRDMGYTLEATIEQTASTFATNIDPILNYAKTNKLTQLVYAYFVGTGTAGAAGLANMPASCTGLCSVMCWKNYNAGCWISWSSDQAFFNAVTAQEIHHNVGFSHTHDDARLNKAWIDTCGIIAMQQSSPPLPTGVDKGTWMSYCHLCRGGSANIAPSFGSQTLRYGTNSVRIWSHLRNAVSSCAVSTSGKRATEEVAEIADATSPSATCTDTSLASYTCSTLSFDRNFCPAFKSDKLCDQSCGVCTGSTKPDVASYKQTILYDQGEKCTTNKGLPSEEYITATGRVRAVDSFKVPAGKTWIISNITVMGYWIGALPTKPVEFVIDVYNRRIPYYAGRSILPPPTTGKGVQFNLRLEFPLVAVGAHLNGSTLEMSEEKYFISVVPINNNTNNNDVFLWSFSQYPSDPVARLNSPKKPADFEARWKDRSSTLKKGCTKWTTPEKCGFTLPPDATGLCFQLKGSELPTLDDHKNVIRTIAFPNGGDGEIGSASGHVGLFTDDEMNEILGHRGKLSDNHDDFNAQMDGEAVESGSLNESTPGWAIALLVLFSLFVVGLVVVIALVFLKKPHQERF